MQPQFSQAGRSEFDYDNTGMQWFNTNFDSRAKPMGSSSTATGNYQQQQQYKPAAMRQENSFDMEFMMPPDVMSIDSDINKIGALTPSPFIDGGMDSFSMASNAARAYP